MLSINQTADAIIKRMTAKSKAYRDVYLVKKEESESSVIVVLGASCIELCRESLGRTLVKMIKELNYKNKPDLLSKCKSEVLKKELEDLKSISSLESERCKVNRFLALHPEYSKILKRE